MLQVGETTFLREEEARPNYGSAQRQVYVVSNTGTPERITCPSDASWLNCAGAWLKDRHAHTPPYLAEAPSGPICRFTLQAPSWSPSPDNDQKRRVANELLKELGAREYAREVYARDFNMDDPEIDFYIIDLNGNAEFQGCFFDKTRSPHCRMHGYGQSPIDALRRNVMSLPYRLYPPPMGRVPAQNRSGK